MFAKLESLERKYEDLERQLSAPDVVSDQERFRKLSKTHSDLSDVVAAFREYKKIAQDLEDNQEMAQDPDPEIRELAQAETKALKEAQVELEARLKVLLLPKDPMDEKNILLEIRAGTGGDEAALFAGDLFRMYTRYAETKRWKVEIMSQSETGSGGFKEVIASISGDKVYSRLKYESGAHRVQRVPATESQGRIHTSAVTVAIMPEAEEVDVAIDPNELRIDVYRSSGPGGQSVNTTDSAVRVTHIPSGLVVICQDEKSQHKNKAKALKVLRSRLLQIEQDKQRAEQEAARRSQVGTGDRSERIRTYNFPQGRVTDHRINLTLYRLDAVLEGDLDELCGALIGHYQAEALKAQADAA
ncbi:peptide chain release factor 1 [Solidesulfovibrio carbinolicus]|jgi:peptide chain release factor 1|uniref:Peptide chain release factor 1 n=2 Tax=Solidesulfovibrio TaxID=2910984 RepID=A0A4P6HP45_9BACT|nr:peptide chain release factor 1 [Solidesulfovibrio carbinolicus]EKO37925.1 MAG: peptide chain release factor 1 [Solidesulfovibrio magneticus str. Maddingley MBC34]QAZ66908.1 peptide chain release factor 1 [Solidesulfovibrio carbinolicus]